MLGDCNAQAAGVVDPLSTGSLISVCGCRAAAAATLAAWEHRSRPAGQDLWGAGYSYLGAVAWHEVPPALSGVQCNAGHSAQPALPPGDRWLQLFLMIILTGNRNANLELEQLSMYQAADKHWKAANPI